MARRKLLLWLTPLLFLRQVPNFAVQRRQMSELHVGERVFGVVSHVTRTLALVDVGVEKEGVLPISKMASGISNEVAVGEEVELWVSQVKNEENLRHSSLVLSSDSEKVFSPSPEKLKALEALQELDPGTWLKGFVVAKRPFGYLISVAPPETEGRGAGARAIGLAYRKEVEGAPDVGSEVKVKILNLDLQKQKLSLSMKAATAARNAMEPFQTSKELRGQVLSHGKFGVFVAVKPSEEANVTVGLLPKASVKRPGKLEQLKPGQELEGVVVRTSPEITLVDLGLKQRGLLPPAKMADDTEVHVGDRLQVWVSELRPKGVILATNPKKVMSLKALGPAASLKDYAVNSWYTGIVLRLSPYGAFVAVKSGSGWAEGLVKTNQIQGDDLEVAAEVKVRVQDLDLRLNRMALSMRSEETARKSARFAMLQNLTHEIFAARVIAVEELGADVEVRHPQTGSVLGFLSNSQVKRSKPLQVGEDIEVTILDIDVEKYKLSLSMTQMPRGFYHQDFASLLADELGEGALDMLREGDEVQVRAQVSDRGLELSLV